MSADKEKLLSLIGRSTGKKTLKYGWRELALYALAVGAGPDELCYTYEKDIKVLPMFGALPYWAAAGVEPEAALPTPAVMLAYDVIKPEKAFLNMSHELIIHQPIPQEGTFVFEDFLTNVYDRGEGKGVALESRDDVYLEDGTLICTNRGTTLYQEGGGFGGEPMPKSSVVMPEREPDFTAEDYVSPTQNLLYRLTGDTNLVHVDPDHAKAVGVGAPIMQGFCSAGFAVRMAVGILLPGEPERVKRIAFQMTSMLYPGTPVEIQLRTEGEGKALFKLVNKKDGKAIVNKGVLEWN